MKEGLRFKMGKKSIAKLNLIGISLFISVFAVYHIFFQPEEVCTGSGCTGRNRNLNGE